SMPPYPEDPRRPLPPPPLPPRRPLSGFYGRPEHAPPQQSIYAQTGQTHGEFIPAATPGSPGLPQQQQYSGYGVPVSGRYSPPEQQHANTSIYGRTSNP